MKKTKITNASSSTPDDLRDEYQFDYRKARPNRFASVIEQGRVVTLDPDVSEVFKTSESVNNVLRALIESMPRSL